jgi:hypothetical protein
MRVVIHQPHFLPWLGYFNKLANADVFVALDNVQYRKGYFQNRTRIRDSVGSWQWLTVPVHTHLKDTIREVRSSGNGWKVKMEKRIRQTYSKANHYDRFSGSLLANLDRADDSLLSINMQLIGWALESLEIPITIRMASSYQKKDTASATLVHLCEEVGADEYVFGEGGGIVYHGIELFHRNHIHHHEQDFRGKLIEFSKEYYPGCYNLSVIDYIFHYGASETRKLVRELWQA